MSSEVALALFAGITIIVQVLLHWHALEVQKKSNQETHFRAQLADIKDAASQLVQLRHIQTLGGSKQELSTLVSAYSLATARMHTGAIRVKDEKLNDAVAGFIQASDAYRDMVAQKGLQSVETSAVGGEFQLSLMEVVMRCNELEDNENQHKGS